MIQGFSTFANVPNLGARMVHVRGVQPSVCQILVTPQTSFSTGNGSLDFYYDTTQITFADCAFAESSHRPADARSGDRWVMSIQDRRWKWKYTTIDGVYNRRSKAGVVQNAGKKNARELADILFAALGETNADTTAIPTEAFPPVVWSRSRADLELDWLCNLFGMTVALNLDNSFSVVSIAGNSVGTYPLEPIIEPSEEHAWKTGDIPQSVTIQGDPTVVQSTLTLTPVSRDRDGFIEASPEWKPQEWSWPEFFSNVPEDRRHHAFETQFRWFRPSEGWQGDGVSIANANQLELLNHLVEIGRDPDLENRPLAPVIKGKFWPYAELAMTTDETDIWPGKFKVHADKGLIETDRPVFRVANGEILDPEIKIVIAYRVRKEDQSGYSVYTKSSAVRTDSVTTNSRVLHHPELVKSTIYDVTDSMYEQTGDNKEDLDREADAYLNSWTSVYGYDQSATYRYNGFLRVNPSSTISQIEWACGELNRGQIATTQLGINTEFDIRTIHASQRRALNRLGQMVARMALV